MSGFHFVVSVLPRWGQGFILLSGFFFTPPGSEIHFVVGVFTPPGSGQEKWPESGFYRGWTHDPVFFQKTGVKTGVKVKNTGLSWLVSSKETFLIVRNKNHWYFLCMLTWGDKTVSIVKKKSALHLAFHLTEGLIYNRRVKSGSTPLPPPRNHSLISMRNLIYFFLIKSAPTS